MDIRAASFRLNEAFYYHRGLFPCDRCVCRIAAGRKRFSPDRASGPRLNCFQPLSSVLVPRQPRARRRLPSAVVQSTPEKIQEAVKKLGVNKHRLVHCELPNGKVRTGVVTKIRDGGFMQGWNLYLAMDSLHRPQSRAPARTGNSYWPGLQVGWSWSWRGGPHTIFPIPVPGLGWLL